MGLKFNPFTGALDQVAVVNQGDFNDLVIDADGNVGIGTTSPDEKLEVYQGNIKLGSDTNTTQKIIFERTAAERASVYVDSTNTLRRTSNGHAWFNNADTTEFARIDSSGYLRLSSNSPGIQFNGDTAAANALDDYEEGTHVATVTPGTSGTVTLFSTAQTLSYVKIGRFVNVGGYLQVSAVSSPVGYFDISLPFAVANLTQAANTHSVSVHVRRVVSANVADFVGITVEVGSSVRVVLGDGTNTSDDSAQELQATSWIYVNASYTTS